MTFGQTLVGRGIHHKRQCAGAEGTWAAARLGVEGRRRQVGWHPSGAKKLRQDGGAGSTTAAQVSDYADTQQGEFFVWAGCVGV
jgi:hypothetical protein